KTIRTPGLELAPVKVGYDLTWLDGAGKSITATPVQVPLGIRSALGEGEACREYMPEEGAFVVRIPGPGPDQTPASVRMERTSLAGKAVDRLPLPPVFESGSMTVPIGRIRSGPSALEGFVSSAKIQDTGDDDNRLVIVVLGDGYTLTNLNNGDFTQNVIDMVLTMGSAEPWDFMMDATNIYRVDVESNEAGADHETYGVFKDTYFNSSFWLADTERALGLTGDGHSKAYALADLVARAGVWDVILVLVNSTKYGGTGGGIATSSVNSAAPEVVLHELGHSFAELADEYETEYSGYPAGDHEPNVDYDSAGAGLKWLAWVEPGTPLPTPETSPYLNMTVGSFEGARYLTEGIYRPVYNCKMRSLGPDFCPVCKEAHIRELMNLITLADEHYPETSGEHAVDETGTAFGVMPLPFPDYVYEWTLDGVPIPDAFGTEWTATADDLTEDTSHVLGLTVRFETPLVRLDTLFESYSWTLVWDGPTTCCLPPTVGDCDQSGVIDITDVSVLIDNQFLTLTPLACEVEGDLDLSGVVDITDVSVLIDNQFLTLAPLPPCP
ncbi:MAG: hypothetical protein GY867_04965, partial [bacterium]|nr:hypothetical protein [bacterium]